jgi:kynureninase
MAVAAKSKKKSDPEADLLKLRKEFPTLAKKTHLISHSLGAVPAAAADRLREFYDTWVVDSIEAWHDWLPMVTQCGDQVARIIGAPPGTIFMLTNVSQAMGIIASCLDFPAKRNKVVYTTMNFPSVHYVWKEHERIGAKVELVPSPDGIHVPTEDFIKAIDDQTAAVVVELVLFRSGYIQEAKKIVKAAHDKGAIAIVDAYQAVGTVPVDVVDMDADFFTGGSVKWLCGGPGAGYLYVKKALIPTFEPRLCGWFSHSAPFAFVMDRIQYRDDVMRYMGGTPSIPALYSSMAGREAVLKVGVDRIRAKSKRQIAKMVAIADEMGLKVNTPHDPERRGGMICVDFPDSERVHHELLKRHFLIDWRPKCGIRISPHFYTTDDELDAVFAEIKKLRRR